MSQISAQTLSPSLEKELYYTLFQLVADLSNPKDSTKFCKDFFSKTELMVFTKRIAIAVSLDKGYSYEEIRKNLKVSTATISTVAERLESDGYQLALQKIKAEQWAGNISSKLVRMFKAAK
ncbi:MAG TPA: Trp family transcriptional regulator [Candidatus Saccharimonadia bacterium]|nr:Trp family transcriptional regulator [Candidatus Saccharimonadia bacterium]